MITNVDIGQIPMITKQCFQNIRKTFHEISVSKISQGYPRNIIMLLKCFCEVKKLEKLFCGLSCENFNIGSLFS